MHYGRLSLMELKLATHSLIQAVARETGVPPRHVQLWATHRARKLADKDNPHSSVIEIRETVVAWLAAKVCYRNHQRMRTICQYDGIVLPYRWFWACSRILALAFDRCESSSIRRTFKRLGI